MSHAEMNHLADVDYPVSQTFSEYYEEMEGRIFPFIPVDTRPLNDTDLEDPKIVSILETLCGVRVIKKKKGVQL